MARAFAAITGQLLKTSAGKADSRKKLIGAVRAAAARMGLADDDRKAIQLEATGKASMADMNLAEIGKVLDRLNRDRPHASISGSVSTRPHIAKVKALWWTLYWLGELGEPNDAALDSFVQRQTGIASIRFLDHRHAPSVIEALKSMAARAGVKWPLPSDTATIAACSDGFTGAHHDRLAVIDAIWARLVERKIVQFFAKYQYLSRALEVGGRNHHHWTARELDEGIKLLGKKLRADMARQARAEAANR